MSDKGVPSRFPPGISEARRNPIKKQHNTPNYNNTLVTKQTSSGTNVAMSWRQFQFFETLPIRDPSFGSEHPLYSDPSLTAVCAVTDYLVLATHNSRIQFVSQDLTPFRSFTAYEKGWTITFMRSIPNTDQFATIAERQGQPARLKLWSMSKILSRKDDKLNETTYQTLVHVKNGNNSYPITAWTASSHFNIIGVGFANGVVVLIRGDLMRDRGSSQTIAYKSPDPVTGLELEEDNNNDPILYVTTTSKVLFVPTTQGYMPGNETVLESGKGADLGTTGIDGDKLFVGRTEGVVYHTSSAATYSMALEMPKKKVFKFGKYLLIVSSNTIESSSLILNGYAEPTKIVMADTEHKLISMSHTIASTVQDALMLWGDIYVLSSDGMLYKIHEKSIETQIEIIMKRDLYPIAIQIAENNVDHNALLKIKKQYGDYLYAKDETTEAMDQYIATLSLGKTSEIIKMYKDSKEVGNLSRYLEEMLKQGLATKEHVTLLLCTYCKLKAVDKLDDFINRYDKETNELMKVEFDLDVVIELCRDINFLDHASKLAQNLGYSSLAVDILLREHNDPHAALKYIKTLPVDDTLRILVEYARRLLDECPNVTTALLIDVFTGKYKPEKKDTAGPHPVREETPVILQSYKAFVDYMSSAASTITASSNEEDHIANGNGKVNGHSRPTYQPPRPRIIFPSFVNRPNEFVIFLEACAESYDFFEGNEKDKVDILTTLFELYLTLGDNTEDPEAKKSWQKKALDLAQGETALDSNSLLLISNVFDFNDGEILAREGPGFEIDLFRSAVAAGDVDDCVAILEKYGSDEPELYPLALMFYTSSDEVFSKVGEERFKHVLDKIKKDRIMTPLEFIQALSVNNVATVDLIKDYIIDLVESERKEIEINEKLIASYRAEVKKKQEQIHKLATDPTITHPTKCCSCSNKLDGETVHFACGHSYHKSCISEEDRCPRCTPARETIHNIRENQKAIGGRNDLFEAALEDADNRFRVITDFFGKGAMERVNYVLSEDS
ncbi:CYFA0S13e03268g1_1 [Cyberlindnera fabianii]|uniref:E3 ubiquitin-protein ligase PEP5 n=1 Tax=Cyberlindnera fabianii TaxID=36022 RepID=A0A061B3Q2_CYBFA|nr:CYFA0S13e03268g1_1 [Cyberlindnera fabianii]